jgi:hypothetical protein
MLVGCGADVELDVIRSTQPQRVQGTVELPNGTVASAGSGWQRLVAFVIARADALTGAVSRVGAGVRVELVRLSREAAAAGEPGDFVDAATTADDGSYVIPLPQGTDANTCRFLVQVGDADEDTLTRAFVHTGNPTRIDFRSEATVRLVLAEVPPANLCAFDNADIAAIAAAVGAVPGEVTAGTIADANESATGIAGGNAGVQNAIAAAVAGS